MFIVLVVFGTTASAKNSSKVLESVPESERAVTLAKIIHSSGRECGQVTRTFLQGYDKDDAAYWNVTCSNGLSYNVQVPSDPATIARILECRVMKVMGVECFRKFSN